MPRTDREIFEYMRYYNTTEDRKWTLENLCRVERKTPEEIRAICDKFRNKEEQEVAKPKFSDELKEAVLADKASGMKTGDVAERHGLAAKQVENICTAHRVKTKRCDLTISERQEIVQMLRDGAKRADIAAKYELDPTGIDKIRNGMDTNPHYTYKMWDNITVDERESILKRIHTNELSITAVVNGWLSSNQVIQAAYNDYCKKLETQKGYWCAVLDQLKDFASGVVGAGARVTVVRADEEDECAQIRLVTPDGKTVQFVAEVVGRCPQE